MFQKTNRNSHPEVFYKKDVLRNFAKTPVPESFFNKVVDLRPAILLKTRLWHRYFPVNFAKRLRTSPVAASELTYFSLTYTHT